jgi:colanic acid biosynthesis glycosyl transferase WcaI
LPDFSGDSASPPHPLRILIVGLNFSPEPTGVGKYSGEMAAWLASRGHRVTAVSAPPYYPFWRIGEGYRAWRWQRERVGGTSVIRCPLYVPQHH